MKNKGFLRLFFGVSQKVKVIHKQAKIKTKKVKSYPHAKHEYFAIVSHKVMSRQSNNIIKLSVLKKMKEF